MRTFKLKTLATLMFYLSLWDISTDICYLSSRPAVNEYLWKLSAASIVMNLFGPMMILILGQVFNTFIHTVVFKSEKFVAKKFAEELKEMVRLSHSFVFKTILQENIQKKKAIFRTAFLIHIAFETTPQIVLQGITNQKFGLWLEPLSIVSFVISCAMFVMTFVVVVKTDKYYL